MNRNDTNLGIFHVTSFVKILLEITMMIKTHYINGQAAYIAKGSDNNILNHASQQARDKLWVIRN